MQFCPTHRSFEAFDLRTGKSDIFKIFTFFILSMSAKIEYEWDTSLLLSLLQVMEWVKSAHSSA